MRGWNWSRKGRVRFLDLKSFCISKMLWCTAWNVPTKHGWGFNNNSPVLQIKKATSKWVYSHTRSSAQAARQGEAPHLWMQSHTEKNKSKFKEELEHEVKAEVQVLLHYYSQSFYQWEKPHMEEARWPPHRHPQPRLQCPLFENRCITHSVGNKYTVRKHECTEKKKKRKVSYMCICSLGDNVETTICNLKGNND